MNENNKQRYLFCSVHQNIHLSRKPTFFLKIELMSASRIENWDFLIEFLFIRSLWVVLFISMLVNRIFIFSWMKMMATIYSSQFFLYIFFRRSFKCVKIEASRWWKFKLFFASLFSSVTLGKMPALAHYLKLNYVFAMKSHSTWSFVN